MKPILTCCLLFLNSLLLFGQNNVDELINELKKNNYSSIYKAKEKLVGLGKEAIPQLVEMLNDTTYQKIAPFGDLIYPGSKKFYGHGSVVYYDIDWFSNRAAWILEKITFKDFGYKSETLHEDSLFKISFDSERRVKYLSQGYYEVDFSDPRSHKEIIKAHQYLAKKVAKWWEENKATWTKVNALQSALESKNPNEQLNALNYLRHGTSYCEGLTKESYEATLKPSIENISKQGNTDPKEQAEELLNDKEYYWLTLKKMHPKK